MVATAEKVDSDDAVVIWTTFTHFKNCATAGWRYDSSLPFLLKLCKAMPHFLAIELIGCHG